MGEANETKKLVHQLNVRLDEEVLARIERYAQQLEQETGFRVSRGEIARRLILIGLSTIES